MALEQVPGNLDLKLVMDAPIVVEPGTYCQIYLRIISGMATASQTIRGTCFINGYFE
jgi:hypothetical protein